MSRLNFKERKIKVKIELKFYCTRQRAPARGVIREIGDVRIIRRNEILGTEPIDYFISTKVWNIF